MSAVHSQSPSDALIVISANIEGLTANKASILSELCKDKHCHCLCLQETPRAKDQARPSIPGMALVDERPTNMEALFLLEMVLRLTAFLSVKRIMLTSLQWSYPV